MPPRAHVPRRALVDVRSIPSSGRFPHFKRRALEGLCKQRGVSYRHCPELGNKVGGIAHLLRQPEGRAALAALAAAAAEGATAYMCAEADWRDCHRQVISQRLFEDYGITSTHILRDGSAQPHPADHVLPVNFGVMPGDGLAAPCCPEPAGALGPHQLPLAALTLGRPATAAAVAGASPKANEVPPPPMAPADASGSAAAAAGRSEGVAMPEEAGGAGASAAAGLPRVRRWGRRA